MSMLRTTTKTILQRLVEENFPISLIYDALNNTYREPLARLILDSEEISKRGSQSWDFKSLADFGEEEFIANGHVFWVDDKNNWFTSAARDFSERVYRLAWFEEDEGLQFWVKTPIGTWRLAQKGDESYDFVCRLREEQSLDSLQFAKAPRWAEELFINSANYDAYTLMWHQEASLENYKRQKNMKAEAVLRETRRLMGVQSPIVELVLESGKNQPGAINQVFDPSDRPPELDCANLAFHSVLGGYGDPNTTFRNRLIAWIEEHYPEFGVEARERIATVANPDKSPGRSKRPAK